MVQGLSKKSPGKLCKARRTGDYDPEIGRWLERDPSGFMDGTNLYAYVGNDPINYIDPDGEFAIPIIVFTAIMLNPTALDTAGAAVKEIYSNAAIVAGGVAARFAAAIASIRIQGPDGGRIIGSTIKTNGERRPFFRFDYHNLPLHTGRVPHYHTPWSPKQHNTMDPFIMPSEMLCPK